MYVCVCVVLGAFKKKPTFPPLAMLRTYMDRVHPVGSPLCMYVCFVCVCMFCVCVCVYLCVCMFVCVRMFVCVCMFVCVFVGVSLPWQRHTNEGSWLQRRSWLDAVCTVTLA